MFNSDVECVRLSRGYSYAVTNGRLLCHWYASGTIHEWISRSSNVRSHGSSSNDTLALTKCPRSRCQQNWHPGCLVASTAARLSPASRLTAVQSFREHGEPWCCLVEREERSRHWTNGWQMMLTHLTDTINGKMLIVYAEDSQCTQETSK